MSFSNLARVVNANCINVGQYAQEPFCARKMKTIRTKILFNITSSQFLGLGFGSISDSTADAVCVSAFSERRFAANSAIGAIDRLFAQGALSQIWKTADRRPGSCSLIEISKLPTRLGALPRMHYLLIISMGEYDSFLGGDNVSTLIQTGLCRATELLRDRPEITQLDLTALATQYGGLAKRQVFDLVAGWTQKVFQFAPTLNAVRFVANDVDTFIELFETICRLQNWSGKDLRFTDSPEGNNAQILQRALREIEITPTAITLEAYEALRKDIHSAMRLLDQNPTAVLLLCRAVVEAIDRKLAKRS